MSPFPCREILHPRVVGEGRRANLEVSSTFEIVLGLHQKVDLAQMASKAIQLLLSMAREVLYRAM